MSGVGVHENHGVRAGKCILRPALHSHLGCAAVASSLLFALVVGSSRLFAQRFVVLRATIDTTSYVPASTNGTAASRSRSFAVKCVLSTNEWRIENTFSKSANVKWLFDGTNVLESVQVVRQPPAGVQSKVATLGMAVAPFEVAKSNLTIRIANTPGGLPLGDVGVNIPWLAFCSGTYLKREERAIPLPVATHRNLSHWTMYSDEVTTYDDELGLPRRASLFTEQGSPKFHYAVLESTNYTEWNIPLKFEYQQRERDMDGKWFVRYSGVGTVTEIGQAERPEPLFVPGIQETITDYRFRDDEAGLNGMVYASTADHVLSTNDPMLKAMFASKLNRWQSSKSVSRSQVRWIILTLFIMIALAPIVPTLIRRWRVNN